MTELGALARFARRSARRAPEEPRCDLCAVRIGERHRHVVDRQERRLACSCRACALLFTQPGAAGGRYQTVPERVRIDPDLDLSETGWEELDIPVHLAFFFWSSAAEGWVGFYPSPAGAVEAEISPASWDRALGQSPLSAGALPDVEAILCRGRRGRRSATFECFLVPIDVCYRLVGLVRRHWKGIDGGDEVRGEIEALFGELRSRARPLAADEGGKR